MKEIICKCGCGRKKKVRGADIKRGWGQYFSKACTPQAKKYGSRQKDFTTDRGVYVSMASGYEGHGQS